ncbi:MULTISPECIES: pheA operon leader peptide PheL [Enterobacteriaceae]|uniref:PheA operon leader peptide PheL n=1 Tax=Dryocola boscaweniae TaxID=2925397 RepID=A0A9X2W4J3_9ENTR|nr:MULTISPECIES: pheA operon leader peptide PheL [Enterobacteriaceae]MCT4700570.1 pheA operon leader peptide PheL [Dryocola boscaweniae]MCT4715296.1 pheA operon leader peptide PheL [Dryocola boscaweniae]MCT4717726.1 pheA operon leader peptide PheL [Dryocola boscaweniae]
MRLLPFFFAFFFTFP